MKNKGTWNNQLENKRYEYNLDKNSVVIDLGAYTGNWAKQIANKFNCTVHSYEAVERYFSQIQHKNVIPYKYAITCKTGVDYMHVCDEGSAIEALSEYKKQNDTDSHYQANILSHSNIPLEAVNTIDINELLNDYSYVDLLKINIEGGEYDILEKMCETKTINKVHNIQIQFHNFVDNAQSRYDNIVNNLKNTHTCIFDSMWRWSFWEIKK